MTKKHIKKVVAVLFASIVALFCCLFVGDLFKMKGKAEDGTLQNANIQDGYYLGDTVFFANSYEIVYNGMTYPSTKIALMRPDGAMISIDGAYTLGLVGKYKVICYATTDGKQIQGEQSFTVLKNASSVLDVIAPQLSIPQLNGLQTLNAKKGKEIQVLSATTSATDVVNGIAVEVCYGKNTAFENKVVLDDGVFTPNRIGLYTVTYTARDYFGNVGQISYQINCIETSETLIDIAYTGVVAITAGEKTCLSYRATSALGNPVNVQASVSVNDSACEVDEDGYFIPDTVGEYTVTLTATDMLYTETQTQVLTCTAKDLKRIVAVPMLPRRFIKDLSYSLDECVAYQYTNEGKKPLEMQLLIKYDDGDYAPYDHEDFTIRGNEKATLKFVCKTDETLQVTLGEVAITDVEYRSVIKLDKYFVGDVKPETKANALRLVFTETTGNAQLSYINALNFNSFALQFVGPTGYNNYEKMVWTFTDYYNPSNAIQFKWFNVSERLYFGINDEEPVQVASLKGENAIRIEYRCDEDQIFIFENTTRVYRRAFVSNLTYALCYFDIEVCDLSAESALDIKSLNLNNFGSNTKRDIVAPNVYADKLVGQYPMGDVVTIKKAVVADVLGSVNTKDITVEVTTSDGLYVKSVDGVELDGTALANCDYKIQLDKLSVYTVAYYATDQANIMAKYTYFIQVVDLTCPELYFNDGSGENTVVEEEAGYKHTIKAFTAKSKLGLNVEVEIMVVCDGGVVDVTREGGGYSFMLNKKTSFAVYIFAKDTQGNYTINSYTVVAK